MNDKMDEVRMHIRASIVGAVMDGADRHVKVEELDGGAPAGVMATHRVVFNDHVVYCMSEEDAKVAESAFLAMVLALAVKFAGELTGGEPGNEPAGERRKP